MALAFLLPFGMGMSRHIEQGGQMRTTRSSAKPKIPATETRDVYVSFNRDEWAALLQLGFRERWCYMQMKWLANFKTGMVGNFRKQKLSYQDIAGMVTAPGVQGRGMGGIDDTQAADFLARMQAVGLVANIDRRATGGLLFELPLSPINRKSAASGPATPKPISPEQAPANPATFPDDDIPPFDESPASMRVCDAPAPSPSVLALTESKNNTDGQRPAKADAAPLSRAAGAAPSPDGWSGEPPRASATGSDALTPQTIQAAFADDWDWVDTATPQAFALYAEWARAGLTAEQLGRARNALEADWSPGVDSRRPADLTPHLAAIWSQRCADPGFD
jgi:hypothetical protein